MTALRREGAGLLFDIRVDGVGMMLRASPEGDLVQRKMVELEEGPQLDNIRSRGFVMEHRFTVMAVDGVTRRDGKPDRLSTAQSIKATLQAAAARPGPAPTTLQLEDGEVIDVSIHEYSPQLIRSWPSMAWNITITARAPTPVR